MGLLNRLSIQSKLLLTLLLTSILAISVTGAIGYTNGKTALANNIFNQLTSLRSAKAHELESHIQFTRNHVLTLSESPTVIEALKEFKAAYRQLDTRSLTPAQQSQLESYYRDQFVPKLAKNVEATPAVEPFLPQSPAAAYLQYHYIATNEEGAGREIQLDDAGDGSEYSRLHREYQPLFRSIAQKFGYDDILLVDVDTGEVVYSVAKQIDFVTNLETGPLQASVLADAVEEVRTARDPNFVTNVDLEPYCPSFGLPTAFTATTVFDGGNFIGALIFQSPVSRFNQTTTAAGAWREVGLGETGEIFLVGADGLLRSEPRLFIENKKLYFQTLKDGAMSERDIERIRRLNTTILNQQSTVDVASVLKGNKGTAFYKDYRNAPVLSAFEPVEIGDLTWALVAEIDEAEAFAPINQLTRRILAAAAILIPVIAFLSNWLARLFVRPIERLITGTRRIAAGETKVEVKTRSKDEYGELAQSFNQMAYSLHQKGQMIQEKIQEIETVKTTIQLAKAGGD